MAFKVNISDKGKTYKVELESEDLIGKKIGDKLAGNEILPALAGYELEITGTSDNAGFAGKKEVKGPILKRVLFTQGKYLKKTPHKGFRRKKTVRGTEISASITQINTKVIKQGTKKLEEVFQKKEEPKAEETPAE